MTNVFRHSAVERLVRLAVEEDFGRGDLTSLATIPAGQRAEARMICRETAVIAGLPLAGVVFELMGSDALVSICTPDGDTAAAGQVVARLTGEVRDLLGAERTILNFVQRLSGIATLTRRFADAAAGSGALIIDTRKTLPGWRLLDKYAVHTGGGRNHRFGLDDGILIKDNHVAACGGITKAIEQARQGAPHHLRVEIECDSLDQVDEALAAGADAILLDNMSTADMAEAVRRSGGRAPLEASGGMTLDRISEVAATGVDWISVGALTHSAPSVDLTLEIVPTGDPP